MDAVVRVPDIEVAIRVAGSDVSMVCFYKGKRASDHFEIVASVPTIHDVPYLVECLNQSIETLKAGHWKTLDELDTRPIQEKNELPF